MRRNSGEIGSLTQLKWLDTSESHSGIPGARRKPLGRLSRVAAMTGVSRDADVHMLTQLVHTRSNSVEGPTAVCGEGSINPRLVRARSGGAAPEIRAALTKRVERAYQEPRTAGERRA